MEIEKNSEGHVRYAGVINTVISNGYLLYINLWDSNKDNEDIIEYYFTEDEIRGILKFIADVITNFGLPRKGDTFDIEEFFKVKKVYYCYTDGVKEIRIDLVI